MTETRTHGGEVALGYVTGDTMSALPAEDDEPAARPGDEQPDEPELRPAPEVDERIPDAQASGPPAWAKIPKGFKFPRGTRPIFIRFRPETTRAPHKGERQCILWELTDLDESAAAERAAGFPGRGLQEFAKGTIRAIDGAPADWSGIEGPASVDTFWRDIGPKGRSMIVSIYQQTHAMNAAERADFFTNCVAARSVA